MTKNNLLDPQIRSLFDELPGAWACKDIHSTYLYVNAEYGKVIGLKRPEEATGKTDFEIPGNNANGALLFQAQDKKVMQSAKHMRVLNIYTDCNNQSKAYLFTKSPLKNDNQHIAGILLHGIDITSAIIKASNLFENNFTEENNHEAVCENSSILKHGLNSTPLTNRQAEVLFFLLQGKASKQIAKILKISPRTIEEYLEQLHIKFETHSKQELTDKAYHLGFTTLIPRSLLKTQLSIELQESID